MPAARRPYRGFTLLEVMIVVGMAGLVMAISIPFVQRTIHRDAVYQAVKTLDDACRNARALAILNNTYADLVIRPLDRAFDVRPGTVSSGLSAKTRASENVDRDGRPLPAPSAKALKPFSGELAEDVTIELLDVNFVEHKNDEETHVRFQPNGTADEFTIVVRIGTTAWRKLTIDIVTGLPFVEVMR